MRGAARVALSLPLLLAFRLHATPQQSPLRRTFTAGEARRYRIRLIVRSELEGPDTVKIGAVTYVKTVLHAAEARLAWTVSESVTRSGENGAAEIREQQEVFEPLEILQEPATDDAQAARLAAALRETLSKWASRRSIDFQVAASGAATGIPADAAPQLDESPPPFLTLWLLHALRPTAALPERPVRAGDVWQDPRTIRVAGWTDVRAGETGEWLEGIPLPGNRAALRLHVTQEISGRIDDPAASAASASGAADSRKKPPAPQKTERFFAESLSTIALEDGSVVAASRSARKEIIQMLAPVTGMAEPPRFRATLSVQVEIENCVEARCDAAGNP
jgi:hypothetical protein